MKSGPNSKGREMATLAGSIELCFRLYLCCMLDIKVNSLSQTFMYCRPRQYILLYTPFLNLYNYGIAQLQF